MSVAPRYVLDQLNTAKAVPAEVKNLPQKEAILPLWLRFLLMLQQSSSVFACCTVMSALAVYGLTVYTPRHWNQQYQKLTALQRHERNLTATNETLKNELAQQAERPEAGLAIPNPEQVIFLPATPPPADDRHQTRSDRSDAGLPTPATAPNAPLAY
ncbi:MAG: hypothetical protein ACFB4I_23025 [Cyanophyceae cyanobacterium]